MSDGSCMTEPICNITLEQAGNYIRELRGLVRTERDTKLVSFLALKSEKNIFSRECEKRGAKIKELEAEVERLEKAYDEMEQRLAERGRKIEDLKMMLNTTDAPKHFDVLPPPWGPDYAWGCVLESDHRDNVIIRGTKEGLEEVQRRWKKLEQIEDVLKGNPNERLGR